MNARTKRRVRAGLVASALGSGIVILIALAMLTIAGGSQTTWARSPDVSTVSDDPIARQAEAAVSELSVSGEITQTSDDSFKYKDKNADVHTVMVDKDTIYTLDGSEALFSSLKVGHSVSITLKQDGNNMVAKSVDASSRTDK